MSKKQQEKKRKKRQEIAKKRVIARRLKLRKQFSDDKKASRLDRKFRNKIAPIINDPEKKKIMEEIKNQKILSKLEKNAEILKQLEEAYINETEKKKKINEELEKEGHKTLSEKLNALEKKVRDNMTEEQKESGMIEISN